MATVGIVFVGKCIACKAKYSYVETARGASDNYRPNAPYCECRTGVPCACFGQDSHDHPATAIRWKAVNTTVTSGPCAAACTGGVSNKCACSCGGTNHGLDHRISARNA